MVSDLGYNYNRNSEFDAYAPIRKAFDITLSATPLSIPTRAIMVSTDCTVTGILVGDTVSHTTFTLTAGVLYPLAFSVISAATASATLKGYA